MDGGDGWIFVVLGRFDVCFGVGGVREVFWGCLKGGVGAFRGRFMGCWGRLGVLEAFGDIAIQVRCLMKY